MNAYKNARASSDSSDSAKSSESAESVENAKPKKSAKVVKAARFPVISSSEKSAVQSLSPTSNQDKIQVGKISKNKNNQTEKKTAPSINNENSKSASGDPRVLAAAKALKEGGLLKVPVKPKESDGKENVYRRVAKFLLLIGVEQAAKILPHFTDAQTEKIIPEIASIRTVGKEEAEEILQEFDSLVKRSRESGGTETARNILEKAFGSEKAEELLEKAIPFKGEKPFEYLYDADPEKIILLLKDESEAVCALVLSYLKPEISASVIKKMSETQKKDVILRLARMKSIDPQVIKKIDSAMQKKMNSLSSANSQAIDGKSALAEILKKMDTDSEEKILETLSLQDPELGSDLREKLFTIEDVINSDDRFIQKELQQMSDIDIVYLIGGKNDDFRAKILSNVSQNRGSMILQEESDRKPLLKKECEKTTATFFGKLRKAWEKGTLIIKGRNDEIYV